MEGVTIDTPKEKLGTPGFLKSIGSIFSKLSPKQFKRSPKLPQPTDAIQEQREDWAQTKGKALARTPIQPKRLYPNLEEVEEDEQRLGADLRADSEDGDDESVDEAGPSKPVRRNRNLRVKGQPPTRISTRIRGEPPAPLENEHIEINVLINQTETVINEQENLSVINELRRAKSSDSESDEEEITVNRKNLIKRVEQKEKVETRPTSEFEEEKVTVKITNPRKKVEQKGKVKENKKTKVRSITPDRLSETNPFRKVEQKGKVEANKKTKRSRTGRNHLAKDCRVKSNQSYYNSQKLLQNQQQMTISLLAQVPAFNGMGSTKFEDWIKHFERVIDTSEFEEGKSVDLEMRELMIMDRFLGGPKSNLRERMSFKEFKNLKDLVKATENCAAILNEAKLEKRNNNQQSHNHSNQFGERNTQGPQPPPKYGSQPNNQANRYPPREAKYCAYCAKSNASNPVTHNTDMCGFGPQENTRLTTRGLITLEISVLGDNLLQDFIVVDGISEECILGLDALYEHKFIIDGSERKIYRVKKTTLPDSVPTIMAGKKITIKPFSATVVESEGNGAQLPPNLAFYLNRGPGLNSG
ncbi:hypothetical protein DAPPUDRAFT_118419 [Daphnia pulex]|uniref:Uncharacterized protein n=1 Tax=Daphnia pulex TaxID=6669 RepID=E9HVN9_DAPPU|nr:hypothetical protein DAPPUDRAFT_118419 [Daphnia pulex]|eukprot:EFX64188.1 hypothetical protein DAPPUDRAFT_118419 [Daphnia pulex]